MDMLYTNFRVGAYFIGLKYMSDRMLSLSECANLGFYVVIIRSYESFFNIKRIFVEVNSFIIIMDKFCLKNASFLSKCKILNCNFNFHLSI